MKKVVRYFKQKIKAKLRKLFEVQRLQLHGVCIDLTCNYISPELREFFYSETYEGEEIRILSKYLSKDDVVMELGAGIGFLSTFCAKKIGSEKVYAYEANPYMVEKIRQTYKLNNVNPTLKNVVLSNKKGNVSFYLEKDFWSSSIVKRSNNARCVQMKSIDINEEINLIKPTFLIIDIEGGEKDLIYTIDFRKNSIQKIIIEIHPHIIGEYEASKIIEYIISNGFYINFKEMKDTVFLFTRRLR